MPSCRRVRLRMGKEALQRPLRTERFTLTPLSRPRAFLMTFPWTKDLDLMRSYTGSGVRRSHWKWYREMTRPNGRTKFVYSIVPHGETRPIGMHVMNIKPYRTAYLAVVIKDREWWGKGVVEEVRRALIDHFLEHAPVDRFSSQVNARNFPSIFNYRRLGFDHVGTLHRAQGDPSTGAVSDMLVFELLRENWKGGKAVADE